MIEIFKMTAARLQDEPELLKEYAKECSIPELGEINPQWAMYDQMERAGMCQFFGAFDGEQLIGFASLLIYMLPHYGVKAASCESIFTSAAHRKSGAGSRLIKRIEIYAKEQGCKGMLYSAPTQGKLELLLSFRKSCRRTNAVFCKKL